jgi:hypothetical protein
MWPFTSTSDLRNAVGTNKGSGGTDRFIHLETTRAFRSVQGSMN